MPLKYIYIDSNSVDRLHFYQTLKKFSDFKLMAEFSDAVNALEFLNYNEIDFAVISSDLNVHNGFELFDQLKQKIHKSQYFTTNICSDYKSCKKNLTPTLLQ